MKKFGALYFIYVLEKGIQIIDSTSSYEECIFDCQYHKKLKIRNLYFIANVLKFGRKFKGISTWSSNSSKIATNHLLCCIDIHDHNYYIPMSLTGTSPSQLAAHFNSHNAKFKYLYLYVFIFILNIFFCNKKNFYIK